MNNTQTKGIQCVNAELLHILAEEQASAVDYVIQAGYFESSPDSFARHCLDRGLELKAALENQSDAKAEVYTLQNNFGVDCNTDCELPSRVARASKGLEWKVPLIQEKTALNRGLRHLRKLLRANPSQFLIQEGETGSVICFRDSNRKTVKLAVSRGNQLIGFCPLVLASFYEMLLHSMRPGACLIDYCHYVEVQKVATAVDVLNRFFLEKAQRPRMVIAAALNAEGLNMNPIVF